MPSSGTCRPVASSATRSWSFVYGKDRNIPKEIRQSSPFTVGSIWTWTCIDSDSKLMLSWFVGVRDEWCAEQFIRDVAARLSDKVQMTTDGLKLYLNAVEGAFGGDIDYAMLTKLYGPSGNLKSAETRYSPGRIKGSEVAIVAGEPDKVSGPSFLASTSSLPFRFRFEVP